tara:strand:+ start:170 stop:1111 length:942 start_codon:yes stop_codon:yes gene_type:complete
MRVFKFHHILLTVNILLALFAVLSSFFFELDELNSPIDLVIIEFSPLLSSFLVTSLSLFFSLLLIYLLSSLLAQHKLPTHKGASFWLFPMVGLSLFFSQNWIFEPLLGFFILIIAFYLMFQLSHEKQVQSSIFTVALMISFSSLFYLPLMAFYLLPFFALIIFRTFQPKEHITALVGLTVPWIYYSSAKYLFDLDIAFALNGIHEKFVLSAATIVNIVFLGICGLLGIFQAFANQSKLIVQQRNQMSVLLIFLIISIVLLCFQPTNGLLAYLLVLALSAFYIWFYKGFKRKWIIQLVFFFILTFQLNEIWGFI